MAHKGTGSRSEIRNPLIKSKGVGDHPHTKKEENKMTSLEDLRKRQSYLRRKIIESAQIRDYEMVEILGNSLADVEEQIARKLESN